MLVLSRHQDETIVIGDNIRITVISIQGDKVRLGIEAPRAVPVHREEVYTLTQPTIHPTDPKAGDTARSPVAG